MKREKFLWPLTQGHHGALVAARNIRNRLASLADNETETLLKLGGETANFFKQDLAEHFRGEEEEVMKAFEVHRGPDDPDVLRIRKDHDVLENLSQSATKAELQLFADTLTAHIRFEEDVFFPKIEAVLTDEEKNVLTGRLLPFKPGLSHCPLPL